MRSSVLLYPALLQRLKKITIRANTKGCSLGVREIDPHLEILRALGAEDQRRRAARASRSTAASAARATGCDYMSVTVTENFAMAAALAEGRSTLDQRRERTARAGSLRRARRDGRENRRPRHQPSSQITGVKKLHGATYHDQHRLPRGRHVSRARRHHRRRSARRKFAAASLRSDHPRVRKTRRQSSNTKATPRSCKRNQKLTIEEPFTSQSAAKNRSGALAVFFRRSSAAA